MSSLRFYPIRKDSSYYEHIHRYVFAKEILLNLDVLDISCGEGYGTHILSQTAKNVIGCDIDSDIVMRAKNKYIKDNLNYKVGDCTKMSFECEQFDAIVSFETIEHFAQHEEFLSEVKRVLRKDGIFIVSTPDKTIYSDERNYHNEDHVKELTKSQFVDLLKTKFKYVELYGQKFTRYSTILKEDKIYADLKQMHISKESFSPMFLIAVCSNKPILKEIENSIFGDNESDSEFIRASKSIKELERQIILAKKVIQEKDNEIILAKQSIQKKDNEIILAKQSIQKKDNETILAKQTIQKKDNEIILAKQAIEEKDNEIRFARQVIEEKDNEIMLAKQTIEIFEKK